MKKNKEIIIIALLIIAYLIYKKSKVSKIATINDLDSCTEQVFNIGYEINSNMCNGEQIDENKQLELGQHGCEIRILQQRLNSAIAIYNSSVGGNQLSYLEVDGKFNCSTLTALQTIKGVNSIKLIEFPQVEQTGDDLDLDPDNMRVNYSYMNLE
jgi:hypothetical protein